MRVLLSGSHGLIGSALLQALRDGGHQPVRLLRGGSDGPGAVSWDPQSGALGPGAAGADAVVHLAGRPLGQGRWSPAVKESIHASRAAATLRLCEALAALDPRPRVLISASAVGWYGDRGDEELDETSGPGAGFLAEVCAAWEHATGPAENAGIRTVHLRSGIVLDAKGGALAKQLPIFRLGLGGRLGSGSQYMSWISLEDEVRAVLFLLEAEHLSGAVNATAPNPVTNAEHSTALGRALGRPAVLKVPAIALSVALGPEMARELLLASQRALPRKLEASGFSFRHPEIGEALRHALADQERKRAG